VQQQQLLRHPHHLQHLVQDVERQAALDADNSLWERKAALGAGTWPLGQAATVGQGDRDPSQAVLSSHRVLWPHLDSFHQRRHRHRRQRQRQRHQRECQDLGSQW
jgi:hypothetical protein